MDIQHLIDQLEDLIDEGRHIPMGKYTIIDEERVLSIIDQMRIAIPEQIEAAQRVVTQRDKIMAQANEEAARLVEYAQQKRDEFVDRDQITVAARHQANNIIAQAYVEADQIRGEAYHYVVEVLRELESQLLRNLTVSRNGIAKIMQDQAAIQQAQQAHLAQSQNTAPPQQNPNSETPPLTMPILKREEVSVDNDQS